MANVVEIIKKKPINVVATVTSCDASIHFTNLETENIFLVVNSEVDPGSIDFCFPRDEKQLQHKQKHHSAILTTQMV